MSTVHHALFIIGEPGIGKSTLVAALTDGLPYEEAEKPFAIRHYDCGVLELGKRRDDYPGTDALAMNVQPAVEQWLNDVRPRLLLLEGDRLANPKFITWLEVLGYTVHLTLLVGKTSAEERRAQRGSHQDAKWLKGRQSKVYNLAEKFGALYVSAHPSPSEIADGLEDPVASTLRAAKGVAVG